MAVSRRQEFILQSLASGLGAATYSVTADAATPMGIPGAFAGRVVAVEHPGAIVQRRYQREAVRTMITKGIMGLTGAPSILEAWRHFFQPSDVVGLKLNPVGRPLSSRPPR